MHPFAQYQLLQLALSFAQHLKLIDSLHVWQQIRQTILLLVKNPVKMVVPWDAPMWNDLSDPALI